MTAVIWGTVAVMALASVYLGVRAEIRAARYLGIMDARASARRRKRKAIIWGNRP